MSRVIYIQDKSNPRLQFIIEVSDDTINAVHNNDIDASRNIAKSILGLYKETNFPTVFLRNFNGHVFYIDFAEKDVAMKEILDDFMLHGEYEPHTTELIKKHVKPGDVCVDVGASIGYFTVLFGSLVGKDGLVYTFEPTTNQFEYLTKNVIINGYQDFTIGHNFAAWDKEENVHIKVNNGQTASIPGRPLDRFLPKKVDFIKIDVDGSEPWVLRGLIQTIERNPQLKMVIEYYPEYIEKMGGDPKEVMAILDKYFIYEVIKGEFTDKYWNYFCVRKESI